MLQRVALAALLLVLLAATGAAALAVPPPPDRRVNDYAGALTPAERDRLEQQLAARETTSRNQVVVAIFRSLEGESLEGYSIRLPRRGGSARRASTTASSSSSSRTTGRCASRSATGSSRR